MLEDLREEVRPEHRAAVEHEFARLDSRLAVTLGDPLDLDCVATADGQGMCGLSLAKRVGGVM